MPKSINVSTILKSSVAAAQISIQKLPLPKLFGLVLEDCQHWVAKKRPARNPEVWRSKQIFNPIQLRPKQNTRTRSAASAETQGVFALQIRIYFVTAAVAETPGRSVQTEILYGDSNDGN